MSSSTIVPGITVVADVTQSEDTLNLVPGNAMAECHTRRHPHVLLKHKKTLYLEHRRLLQPPV
jgi:hypothetical protein